MVHRHAAVVLLLALLAATAALANHHHHHQQQHHQQQHHRQHARGRKLFGGYRISPKICQPTNPGRIRSDAPAVCMFNYECSRRRGEVVGACMDGFLFGACCQLPDKQAADTLEKVPPVDDSSINVHEIDHVPDIPILLNPDGTPMGGMPFESTTKSGFASSHISTRFSFSTAGSNNKDHYHNAERPQLIDADLAHLEEGYSALLGHDHVLDELKMPSILTVPDANNDIMHQQQESILSPVTTLLSPDQIFQVADPVDQLPALFSHGLHRTNATAADTVLLNRNGSTLLDDETNDPDKLFRPSTETSYTISTSPLKLETKSATTPYSQTSTRTTQKMASTTRTASSPTTTTKKAKPSTQQKITSTKKGTGTTPMVHKTTKPTSTRAPTKGTSQTTAGPTTPITLTTRNKEDYYTTLYPYGINSGNKKHDDELDKEEIAINHIISILNDTSDPKITTQVTNGPTTYNWVSPDGTSQVKIITTQPGSSSTESLSPAPPAYDSPAASPSYYHYSTGTTVPSRVAGPYGQYTSPHYGGSSSYGSTVGGSSIRPTTNPPAPTVIVLGPYGTEYSTISTPPTPPTRVAGGNTHKAPTNRPILITKKPSLHPANPTVTHNISTVISTNNNKQQIVQHTQVQIHVKDGTTSRPSVTQPSYGTSNIKLVTKRPQGAYTTIGSWVKPAFQLKPSSPNFGWPDNEGTRPAGTTPGATNCDEPQTAPSSDDVNNFPPVRHPELPSNEKDKPTEIITEDEIPTPDFVEDADLNNKVDVFVDKIVQSLQGNFQSLQDVLYNPKNATTITAIHNTVTRRPATSAAPTTRRPVSTRPTVKATRRPATKLTTTPRTSSARPKPTTAPTRKTSTTRRTKPVKKNTTPLAQLEDESTTFARPTETTTSIPEITPNADYRKICGVRPLMKQGRIVGGKGATFGEWPWQVLVREATWLGLFTKNKCGGVLITDKYVITAAHCQPGFLASLVAVFGEFDISGELESRRSVSRNVRRVIVNRLYDPATFENDLALLELETPIQFDQHIVPICMPDDDTDYVNRMATVTGWGRLKYNGGVPSVLQEVKVPIMENSVCQEMFQTAGHSKIIHDSFMCAGYANGQKDSCEGDSGGPLTLQRADGRWILVGTVSHGIKCAAPYLPGVYMRTTYFKPWLHIVTGV